MGGTKEAGFWGLEVGLAQALRSVLSWWQLEHGRSDYCSTVHVR